MNLQSYFKSLLSLLLLFVGMNVFAADEETKYITWDLSKDETTTASNSELTWVNVACSMVAAKASGSQATAADNYYPGTSGKNYTSTRFYKGSTLTFTPSKGIKIISITFTTASTTSGYAINFADNSDWHNATATATTDVIPCTVTITPSNDTEKISVTLGNFFIGCTKVVISYTGNPTSYTRSTSKDKFGTICLPYAFTATSAKIYTAAFTNKDGVTLTEITGSTVSGTPYIYYATGDEGQTFTLSGDASTNPVDASPLTGIFTPTKLAAGDYVMQTLNDTQAFYLVKSGAEPRVTPYKAYIKAADVPTTSDGKAINIGNDGGETESINALNALVNGEAKIYDLNGRKLKTLQKGINIVNGIKVIVK